MWQLCLWLKTWKWCGSSWRSAWMEALVLEPEREREKGSEEGERLCRGVKVRDGWAVSSSAARVDVPDVVREAEGEAMSFARPRMLSSARVGVVEEMLRMAVKTWLGAAIDGRDSPKRRRVAIRLMIVVLESEWSEVLR